MTTDIDDLEPDFVPGEIIIWYLYSKTQPANVFELALKYSQIDIIIGRIETVSKSRSDDKLMIIRYQDEKRSSIRIENYYGYCWQYTRSKPEGRTDRFKTT